METEVWNVQLVHHLGCNMSNVNTTNTSNNQIEHHVRIFMSKECIISFIQRTNGSTEALALGTVRDITHMTSDFIYGLFVGGCRELGIGIVSYCPLGRSFLCGTFKREELIDTDYRIVNFSKSLSLTFI